MRVTKRAGSLLPFYADFGQRNAILVKRPLTPLRRLFRWADALAPLPDPGYDVIHSFNAVPVLTRRPYLITFESYFPRVPEDRHIRWLERWLQKRLLSDQCVALLAWSDYARRQFRWQNRDFFERDRLEVKMEVLYPRVCLRDVPPKPPFKKLRLLFVGKDFMRKGMPAVVRAHQRLQKAGIPVQTTLVSALNWQPDDYVGPPSKAFVDAEVARLRQDGIELHRGLPNLRALELMDDAHFLLMPTLHDTFGLVAIEALAGATPVIATDTCAMPEIVEHGKCGYLLPFENDPHVGKWIWINRNREPAYLEAYAATIESLADSLAEQLMRCWEARDRYEELSAGALARVRERFDVDDARDRLEILYERCRERLRPRSPGAT